MRGTVVRVNLLLITIRRKSSWAANGISLKGSDSG
jgi:hypothetical protein